MPEKIIVAALLFFAVSAAAGHALTFDQVLQQAITQHPRSEASHQEVLAAEAQVGEAGSHMLPRISLGEHLYWTNEPAGSLFINLNHEQLVVDQNADIYNDPPARKDFATRLELTQPLFDSDLWYNKRRAEYGARASRAESRFAEEMVAFEAFRAYLQVQRAIAARAWAESSYAQATEVLRMARERQDSGVGLKADTLRAEVQVLQADRKKLTVENDLLLARQQLAVAIGSPEVEIGIDGPIPLQRFESVEEEDDSLRGDLQALAYRVDEAELAQKQSRAAYLPKAGLTADYSWHDEDPFGNQNKSWTVQANLTWELFDGSRKALGRQRAEAVKRATEARRLERERQVRLAVSEADLRAGEALRHLETAKLAVRQAEESYRLLRDRYQAGLSTLAEVLDAQRDLEQARFQEVMADSDRLLALGNRFFQRGDFLAKALNAED